MLPKMQLAHKLVGILPLEVLLSAMAGCWGAWAGPPPVAPEPSFFTAGLRCEDTCKDDVTGEPE